MSEQYTQLAVIGGGPAGLAAALAAWESGLRDITIIERDQEAGGILNQCIHNGFGLHYFKEELTGPEYAGRFLDLLQSTGIKLLTDSMVLDISPEKVISLVSPAEGYRELRAGAVVLAMGCRERTRGAINIPGDRPAGVFTAGAAQRYVNIEGYLPGHRVVILGSGDIGLIMARRMTLEGAKVLACVELMPYSGGLTRNIVQCLEDYGIPLYLSHTVVDIRGQDRVKEVVVAKVDENRRPIPGTEMSFDCDTLLLSVGLIPENELSRQAGIQLDPRTKGPTVYENMETSLPGVFACGNVVHVHDLVDFVTAESQRAGRAAAAFIQDGPLCTGNVIPVTTGEGVTYTVPQAIRRDTSAKVIDVFFRVNRVFHESRILVTDAAGTVVGDYPREHLAPGEMEHILIPVMRLKNAESLHIAIKAAKEGEK